MTRAGIYDWLRDFRRAVGRGGRQAMIETVDLEALVTEIETAPWQIRMRRYPLLVYLVAARTLEAVSPPRSLTRRVALAVDVERVDVERDLRDMAHQLRYDQRRWQERAQMSPTEPAGVL